MSIHVGPKLETGEVLLHFVLPVTEHTDPVSVVGDFNDWTPGTDLLIDHGDGTVGVNVAVKAGTVIHFRYLKSGDRWFDDPDAEEVTAQGGIFHVPDDVPNTPPAPANASPSKRAKTDKADKADKSGKPAGSGKSGDGDTGGAEITSGA